ncbi:hypothetical protein [Streptomyces sp. RFCAC02]|uniref:divisome protein SepX/GlpR n=1 Tax=Streptomyces sp. RFCAC02 TaxID=2499143 RepID=UPI00143DA4FB|nr:hypothetical protein [Streptomyces sp. RFCAC02]
MSSSGLIFAVIVGAWAAYLVPMWLRRQDELNEARPTERFSTAIRLLTRRRAPATGATATAGTDDVPGDGPDTAVPPAGPSADLRSFAEPVAEAPEPAASAPAAARATVLARRRRTTMVLFVAFTLGGIFALSTGGGHLWVPAVPAVLLAAYVVHVRRQERRRYAVAVDRRRAEEAARRLRQRTQASAAARPEKPSKAVVEQMDHAEWVDQQRQTAPEQGDDPETWDPAPVPLPTYVNAPVAPRTARGVDLDGPGTWSAARSTTAGTPAPQPQQPLPPGPQRTPLFDQYADDDVRRAAGE